MAFSSNGIKSVVATLQCRSASIAVCLNVAVNLKKATANMKSFIALFVILAVAAVYGAEDVKTTEKRGIYSGLGYGYPGYSGLNGYYGGLGGGGYSGLGYGGYGGYGGYHSAGYYGGYPGSAGYLGGHGGYYSGGLHGYPYAGAGLGGYHGLH